MARISELKEQAITETPLLLFDCELSSGTTERWSTHAVDFEGHHYDARVLKHDLFEIQAGSEDGIDAIARVSLWLANADSHFSEIERNYGWKGSPVTVRFVFYNLRDKTAASEAAVLFKGIADAPSDITESTLRLTVMNSLNLQRVLLPDVRLERRCPWKFPSTAVQRTEAANGGTKGKYSPFYRCGYSPDVSGGTGTKNGTTAFPKCDRSKTQCQARGMFDKDSANRVTRRFGAIEFVPPTTVVRSYGEKGTHASAPVQNEARYNDFVPLVYGTVWYSPLIIFSKNDGNLTRMEVLLGMGEMNSVLKVLVNDIEIPLGVSGKNMTATGWFNIVTLGSRSGAFNQEYLDNSGNPLGDPYPSMAVLNVVVPNDISDGRSLPDINVLVEGMKLERFSQQGASLGESFTNNPAWVLLDVMRRCGWKTEDIDLASFASAAAFCDELITAHDANGNTVDVARFQCNLALQKRRAAADVIRGIRNSARLLVTYGLSGKLELSVENTLALELPTKAEGSNAISDVNGGWPVYEFGDGTDGLSGILRRSNGEPSIRVYSRSTSDTPNRLTVEFQDAFNEYQQDSLSVIDLDDSVKVGQEISLALTALGIPNFNQAARIARFQLDKAIAGNTFVEFETTVRALGLKAGDLITVTYLKEGFDRQPFRVLNIAPGTNYRTAVITAQIHSDAWYDDGNSDPFVSNSTGRAQGYGIGMPKPLAGKVLDENGNEQLEIAENASVDAGGTTRIEVDVGFEPPRQPAMVGLGIPTVSLAARIDTEHGTLKGGETLYYAVTGGDASGQESGLSFVVRAAIPAGTDTNSVTLTGLSFSSDATCFHVYRGSNPSQLLRIAANRPIATQFTDSGLSAELIPPPDANYDHANLYWRLELQPEYAAMIHSANTVGNEALGMAPSELKGMTVRITRGKGAAQERTITANSATTLTLATKWSVEPDETSWFVVAESGWHFGAVGSCGPLTIAVPTRIGATVHVCGRSANVHDRECAYQLSPVTRWRITGGGAAIDTDVPAPPVFGLSTRHLGDISLAALGFEGLSTANARTVSSATMTLHYWDELSSPSGVSLAANVGTSDTVIDLAAAGSATKDDLIQIDDEVMVVQSVLNNGTRYEVSRAVQASLAQEHSATAPVYHLSRTVVIIPFAKDFFGSPSSGSFQYAVLLPDVRVASAEVFVTNTNGNSPVSIACFTGTVDHGLRTLSGGQYTIQVEGHLAAQTNAAPPLTVQRKQAVRDVFATVSEAPTTAPIEMDVLAGGQTYCHLTIPPDHTYSSPDVDGFGLRPLEQDELITLNIISVPQASDAKPGRDLTVTIRL